jgi:hypothetical protein
MAVVQVPARVLGYLETTKLKQYERYNPPYLAVLGGMPSTLETSMSNNSVTACLAMWAA